MFPPLINDITTTFPNPPEFIAIPKERVNKSYEYNKDIFPVQKSYYKKLGPIECPLDKATCFQFCLQTAMKMSGWKLIAADALGGRIESIAITPIMKYVDDIVIEVREQNDDVTVHMRSKSRVGTGDFGANAKRIKKFFKKLEKTFI